MKKIAVFPGSFDPFTVGHEGIVKRALVIFDEIIIAVGANALKKSYYSVDDRKKMISSVFTGNPRIRISVKSSVATVMTIQPTYSMSPPTFEYLDREIPETLLERGPVYVRERVVLVDRLDDLLGDGGDIIVPLDLADDVFEVLPVDDALHGAGREVVAVPTVGDALQ